MRAAHFLGERLGEVGERGLGGAVVDDGWVGEERVDRAHRNDDAAAGAQSAGSAARVVRTAARKVRFQVVCQSSSVTARTRRGGQGRRRRCSPRCRAALRRRPCRRGEPGPSAVERSTAIGLTLPRSARAPQLVGDAEGPCGDEGAFGGKGGGDGEADAAAGAGDDGVPAGERSISGQPVARAASTIIRTTSSGWESMTTCEARSTVVWA